MVREKSGHWKYYDMFKPEVGMRFDTCKDTYKFYNMYSWVLGFSICCGDNYTNMKKYLTNQSSNSPPMSWLHFPNFYFLILL